MTPDIINIGAIFSELLSPRAIQNLISKTEFESAAGCWKFNGALNAGGYGEITVYGRSERLHRVVAFLMYDYKMNGPLFVLHQQFCPNKNCWNWNHLYIGTKSDNQRDTVAIGNHHEGRKLFCHRGHPFMAENMTIDKRGDRVCLECKKINNDKFNAIAKARRKANRET